MKNMTVNDHETRGSDDKRVLMSRQKLELSGVINARELGGYMTEDGDRVRQGVLIRSGYPGTASAEDIRILSAKLRSGLIIDLRSFSEVKAAPDPAFPGVRYFNLPVMPDPESEPPETDIQTNGSVTERYISLMFGETARKAYKRFFSLLLELKEGCAVLFHSVYGKDRAGLAAALILSLLGVSGETIKADFLLSKKTAALNVLPHTLEYVLSLASVEYGSVTEYIKTVCGLSDTDIWALKNKYLE